MSKENVEATRDSIEAFLEGDWQRVIRHLHPDVIWEETAGLGPDAATYRGIGAAREATQSWIRRWRDYQFVVEEYRDAGDQVVVLARERGHGSISGATVQRELAYVVTFEGEKVVRNRLFATWAEALEAAGLSE
jgi:ketosteroid isomerase-like protein